MHAPQSGDHYEVLWPRAERRLKQKRLAPRPATLAGKTIAQAWDFLFRGDEIFALLEEGLKSRFPDIRFISWKEIGNTHGPNERAVVAGMPSKLKALGVDALVCGIAC